MKKININDPNYIDNIVKKFIFVKNNNSQIKSINKLIKNLKYNGTNLYSIDENNIKIIVKDFKDTKDLENETFKNYNIYMNLIVNIIDMWENVKGIGKVIVKSRPFIVKIDNPISTNKFYEKMILLIL